MGEALKYAKMAYNMGEVPVGAVIVRDSEIIACAHNLRQSKNSPTAHAEVLAIEAAAKRLCTRRLHGCTLYVTLEPCPMCAGAIIKAELDMVVYAAGDAVWGALGSKIHLFEFGFPVRPRVKRGVLEEESRELLQSFFKGLR